MKCLRSLKGFSLTELLVVIAIIGVLSALILATMNRAKGKATSIGCVGNLHQIGTGIRMFVDDERHYPTFYTYPFQSGGKTWAEQLVPYTHNGWTDSLFLCPGYVGPKTQAAKFAPGFFEQPFGSYGYNIGGVGANWSKLSLGLGGSVDIANPNILPQHENPVKVPERMIAIADCYAATQDGRVWGDRGVIGINFRYVTPLTDKAPTRHLGKLNVLFCDGHVESLPVHNVLFDRSDDGLRKWNNDNEPHRELIP